MVDYKDRLKWAMDNRPEGKADTRALSKAMDLSYQAVRKVLMGDTNAFNAANNDIAAAWLGVHSRWLATGKGPRHLTESTAPGTRENQGAYRVTPAPHDDTWIAEAIRTLEAMTPEDRRAAVLNLRVFNATLQTPGAGQALPVAA